MATEAERPTNAIRSAWSNPPMKLTQLLTVAGVHVATFAVALFAVMHIQPDMPELALVVAAITGTFTGAFLYHRTETISASFSEKAAVGGVMAIICVVETLVAQSLWHIMDMPEVEIPISAIGTFVFPFVLFKPFEKSLRRG